MPIDDPTDPYGAPAPAPPPQDERVTGLIPDPSDPSMAVVSFTSGRTATMRTADADALPKDLSDGTQVIPPMGPPTQSAAPMGPPAAPAPDPGFSLTPDQQAATGMSPDEAIAQHQAAQAAPPAQLVPVGVDVGTGAAQHDPNADIVSEGQPAGFGAFSQTSSEGTSATDTVEDPATMGGRVDTAYDAAAGAAHDTDQREYLARQAQLNSEHTAREAQEQQLRDQIRQKDLEVAEHQRISTAIEATPIDENGFWGEGDGRRAGAWIALALSGFLQGVTNGANPALSQMVSALDRAQDRWMTNQQNNRSSQLKIRERLMGSAENAASSARLQLSGIMEKRIIADAQKAGMQPPPSLSTYIAQQGVKRAEEKNAIGSRVAQTATRQVQEEQRATAATGPVRQGDLVLQRLGVDKKTHADAMDPKGLNLGGVVGGASRLDQISTALQAIAAKSGGELPAQGTASWSSLGLAPLAARLGIKNAQEQVNTRQLLEEAKLAYKQTVNIKSIDSENEGKNFNKIMDSGEGETTINAIREKAQEASQNAISIASGVSRDAQGYLDFVRHTQTASRGTHTGGPIQFSPAGRGQSGPDLTAADETRTGGGPAQSAPLAEPTGTSLGEKALATSTTGSLRGTYQRLRGLKPGAPR